MTKIITTLAILLSIVAQAQECSPNAGKAAQDKLNSEYANPIESPLTKEDLKKFKHLDFYELDMDFCVTAKLERTPNEKPFQMATTTARTATSKKYGTLHFTLEGKDYKLDVFQDLDLINKEGFKDYLFLPFTDASSGHGSYSGGRYIDLREPKDNGKLITIDFNQSYNPYCAYNKKYSCPIPPEQNYVDVFIRAGVKAYHD